MTSKTDQENIDEAFAHWWERLGSNMPRPDPIETAEGYRKRTAHCAFSIASACLLDVLDDLR